MMAMTACGAPDATAPRMRQAVANAAISDAVHGGGTAGFYFLPPMVAAPLVAGTYDADIATLNPQVAICDLNLGVNIDCGGTTPATATFTIASSPAIGVDAATGEYHVNWQTSAPGFAAGHTYRVHVRAGIAGARRTLGFADVLLTETPGQAKNLASGDVIVLKDGQTLPVKFRINQGIPGAISVTVDPDTVRTGEGANATATVVSLRGQAVSGAGVTWSSTGAAVALGSAATTSNASGQASNVVTAGQTIGQSTITASSGGLAGSTPLTIVPAIIDEATVLASMNDPRNGVAVAVHNGKVYAIGGRSYGPVVKNTTEVYDPATNQWSYRAPMPTARAFASAAVVNGIIYVMGGTVGGCCGTERLVEAYDPATDTWSTKASMNQYREQFAVTVHAGKVYAIGGWFGSALAGVEAYDAATNTWSPRASMPSPRSGHAAAAANGRIYVVGGEYFLFLAPSLEYDPVTDTWAAKASIPLPRTLLGAAAVGNVVYTAGGWTRGNNGGVNTIEAYDTVTDTWMSKSPLNIPRFAAGVVALNGNVYVVGGQVTTIEVPQLEVYRP